MDIELSYLWRILESWKYISNREQKIRKGLQKIMKSIIKVSKVSVRKFIKKLGRLEKFVKQFGNMCLSLFTVAERSI